MPEAATQARRKRGFDPEAERLHVADVLLAAVPALLAEAEPVAALVRFADTVVSASDHLCGACVWVNADDPRATRPDRTLASTRKWAERLNDITRPPPGRRAARRALASGRPARQRIPGGRRGFFARALGRHPRTCAALAVPFAFADDEGGKTLVLFYADRRDYFDAGMRAVIAAYTVVATAALAGSRAQNYASDQAAQTDDGRTDLHEQSAGYTGATRDAIMESIRVALREDRFVLYYQPQLDTRRDPPAVTGVEALIRMKGEGGEIRSPGEFIGVAEQTPLINDIGEWALNEGLAQAARWRRGGLDLSLGVNIGARHLLSDGFVPQLREALARQAGFPPARLEIEITESAALADLDHARRVLAECRQIGVGVAVDDFGTGHASLTYVQSLPVTRVKLDQHFVRDLSTNPRNMAVIAGTVASSRLLEIDIVAEGVETVVHGLMLIRLGCGVLQGYALTPPLPEADFRGWLRGWQAPVAWRSWAGNRANAAILPLLYAEISHRRHAAGLLGENLPPTAAGIAECALTHWLDGEGKQDFSHLPALRSLHEIHAQYHRSAA
ncbi:MAG: EAL domain-containing protein, partial [Gammaproteobacteria bacterium]